MWLAVLALCLAVTGAVLGVAGWSFRRDAPERARRFRPLPIPKVDVHQHVGPRTLADAVRLGASQGIRVVVNLSGGADDEALQAQLAAAARHPGRALVFMGLDLEGCCDEGWQRREVARLERGKAAGARGLTLYKALGLTATDAAGRRVPVDAPALDPVFEAAGRLGLPVSLHAADPKAFFEPRGEDNEREAELAESPEWSWADRARYPAWQEVFDEYVRRVARHPRTTFIGVHFGNDAEDPAEVGRLLDRLPNLWVDTAGRAPELGRRAATRAVILAHPDRVLFGTDLQWIEGAEGEKGVIAGAGWAAGAEELRRFFDGNFRFLETRDPAIPSPTPLQGDWNLPGLGLPRDVLERLYHRNAEALLGLPPLDRP
ncbi:hypothetical protein AMPC_35650 [Anaeromyxobacter paludicola]|uniref:Amidohydrolase-related domain-containing protein n=2 Tax=Anaeromyxobacter paludicola TaxID=2918171 RepID=A0ABN6NB37_9BACT|nr:hypothetical protein AMPC_35650 [Anaeromyxobacter paludicola]